MKADYNIGNIEFKPDSSEVNTLWQNAPRIFTKC